MFLKSIAPITLTFHIFGMTVTLRIAENRHSAK